MRTPVLSGLFLILGGFFLIWLGFDWFILDIPAPMLGTAVLTFGFFALFFGLKSWTATNPDVWVVGDALYAETRKLRRALVFYSAKRELTVERGYVFLEDVRFWFKKKDRALKAKDIERIRYEHSDAGQHSRFEVFLLLKDGDEVHLFDFIDHVDEVDHADASRRLVTGLETRLGVTVGVPIDPTVTRPCPGCERPIPKQGNCIYCGYGSQSKSTETVGRSSSTAPQSP